MFATPSPGRRERIAGGWAHPRDLDLRDILGLDTNPGRSPVAAHWCDLAPMHCVWRGAGVDSPLSKLVAAGVPVPGAQM